MAANPMPNLPDPSANRKTPPAQAGEHQRPVDTSGATPVPTLDGAPTDAASEAGTATTLVGARFDDFEISEEVGRGGMGVVYKARQISLDRIVAIKMLLAQHFQNPVTLTRFHQEARAAASLDHPGIVKIHQVGHCQHGHYFVMAYIEGDSLDHLITKGPVAITGAVSLVIALARAVHFAHSKGVIHRDLKPANIMLRDKRWPIITDFGIAKVAGRSAGLTQQGAVVGTPSYMAPEQADDRGHSVGPQSDVYSLGAVLYALLTGHPPFEDVTPLSTILKVISPDPPRSVRQLRPEVPEALEQICMKCLAKEAGQRYASAEALSDELKRCRALFSTGTLQKTQVGIDALTGQAAEVRLVAIETNKSVRLRGFVTVVGRGADCDLILRSADVSKRHCQLMWEDQHLLVEDLGSANGTYVNGKKVKRQKLSEGDRLDISGHSFEVHFKKQRPK